MGFNASSAFCEIIDNSTEAEATKIQILIDFKTLELNQKHRRIEKFVFIDDGYGMERDVLFDCLVLGEGTKRLLKKGIGKFGVGATFAGISQGKFVGVYSKIKSGKWLYTQLDIDMLDQGEGIPEPIEQEPPEEYSAELDNQGTIVIWDKIDSSITEKDLDDIQHEIGRIYRKFLTKKKIDDGKIVDNKPISLTINGVSISPYDPMYVTYCPRIKDKELAKLIASNEYPIKSGKIKGKMRITISHLPESWWDDPAKYKPGMDPVNRDERKLNAKNNGISIVREGREMAFGEIAFLKLLSDKSQEDGGSPFSAVDRFTGIEVSFNRDVDKIFGIEANKSRLFLPRYIREEIGSILYSILNTRRETFTKVRGKKSKIDQKKCKHCGFQNDKSAEKCTKCGKKLGKGGNSKEIIQKHIPNPHYTEEEKVKLEKFAKRIAGTGDFEPIYNDLVKGYRPVESWDLDPAGPFVLFEHELRSIIVKYNMQHPFMKKFFETLEDIAERQGSDRDDALTIEEIQRTKTLFDLLLASYGLAEISFRDPSFQEEIQQTLTNMKGSWGRLAHQISRKDIKSE